MTFSLQHWIGIYLAYHNFSYCCAIALPVMRFKRFRNNRYELLPFSVWISTQTDSLSHYTVNVIFSNWMLKKAKRKSSSLDMMACDDNYIISVPTIFHFWQVFRIKNFVFMMERKKIPFPFQTQSWVKELGHHFGLLVCPSKREGEKMKSHKLRKLKCFYIFNSTFFSG